MLVFVWVSITILACFGSECAAEGNLKELGADDILLLNVAAKGRLVERLTDAITRLESAREMMVEYVKACFYNATSKTNACRKCVTEACQKRASECHLDVSAMETIAIDEEVDNIPGVQFLTTPVPVQLGLEGLTENAEEDILKEVPSTLRVKGKQLLQTAETKLHELQEHLQNTVHELPGILPRVKTAIQQLDPDKELNSLIGMASKAADTLTHAFVGNSDMNQTVTTMVDQMPQIMTEVNKKMQQLTSVMNNFVSNAMNHFSEMMNSQVPVPVRGWVEDTDGQIPVSEDTFELSSHQQQPVQNSRWTVKHFRIGGNSGKSTQGVFLSTTGFTRIRRSTIECKDISSNPEKACKAFHFRCAACMNDTAILKESCGKESLKMMLAIKRIDMKSADYLMSYSKHMKNSLIVLKVKYDENSFDEQTLTYKTAYVTAKIGDEIVTYKTSSLPSLSNLSSSGSEIGDEIWMILDEDEHTTDSISKKLNMITHGASGTDHMTMGQQGGQSSASTNSVVWGLVGLLMYLGLLAL